ncbi:MAG: coenzyme F420-0:L-glutamate ligase, partial [Patescibacteria group bacterium]
LQNVTNQIRTFLKKKFGLTHVGVLVTDSKTTPMRWGVTALALSYSGFIPLKNYIDTPDIFGNFLHYTKMSIIDNLACASALVMGEGSEQQPLAVVSDVPFVNFVDRNPTKKELSSLIISREEDIYSPLLKNVKWKKGEKD